MTIATMAMLLGGFVLLVIGAELLVRGASHLAGALSISPLVIGLTVVAYGTSAPELSVSLQAALTGNADIAVANVVGSNIFNVLFILGACAAVRPLAVSRQLVRLEVPIMSGTSVLLLALSLDGRIGFADGALLASGIVAYTVWTVWKCRKENPAPPTGGTEVRPAADRRNKARRLVGQAVVMGAGLALLALGSRWLVAGAVALATSMGVSDVVIGLTIVAGGTSLPEVFTSIMATIRNERDIALGNVIGSNISNILLIIGVASLVTPGGLNVAPSLLNFDMAVMAAAALACLPIFFTDYCISRWEGGLFLLSYAAYTTYLILDATGHDALPAFSNVMLMFVLPLVAVTAAVIAVRAVRQQRGPSCPTENP